MTLPRFVGSAVGDCRNSGTSEFIRIVKRQSGVPSSARKACEYDNIKTSIGHKKNTNEKFVFFQDGEQNNASIDLDYIISNSLQRMVVQKEINRINFFVAVF